MTEPVNNTLRDLFAEPLTVVIAGETLAITPFKAGALPKVLVLTEPFMGELVRMREGTKGEIEIEMLSLVARHGDRVFDLVAVLSGRPREWIDNLPPDEALKLMVELLEVNTDFFIQRFLPALKSVWSRISGRLLSLPKIVATPPGGPTSSSG